MCVKNLISQRKHPELKLVESISVLSAENKINDTTLLYLGVQELPALGPYVEVHHVCLALLSIQS